MKMSFRSFRGYFRFVLLVLIGLAILYQLPVAGFCYVSLGYFRLICPIGFLEACLATRHVYWNLFPALLGVVALVLLFGRVFCSWLCPTSYIGNRLELGLKRILPSQFSKSLSKLCRVLRDRGPRFGFGDSLALLIGLFAGVFIFSYPFISAFCPVGIVTRNLIEILTHFRLRSDLLLLLIPMILGILFHRGWKAACPMGSIRGLIAACNHTFVPKRNEGACKSCGSCQWICPLHLRLDRKYDPKSCIKCFRCIDECPEKAVSFTFLGVPYRTSKKGIKSCR